jgi:predicted RNA-binding Zn ribbon-like protein
MNSSTVDGPAWRAHPAPGDLGRLQMFVNSHAYSGRADQLTDVHRAAACTGVLPDGLDIAALHRLRELREAVRAVLLAHAGHHRGHHAVGVALGAQLRIVTLGVDTDGEGGVRAAGAATGLTRFVSGLAAIMVAATSDGTWVRLKACGNDECRVAFYDHTRSRTGRYCTSGICANRARQRAFRLRHSSAPAGEDA